LTADADALDVANKVCLLKTRLMIMWTPSDA
jgi:hypothetical protein